MNVKVNNQKQYSSVRGVQTNCINYIGCPLCYGCRAFDSRDPECKECESEDNIKGRKYNVCKKNLHEAWKINKIITKRKIIFDRIDF